MITYDALMRYAKTLEGQVLETSSQHKKFTVKVAKNGLVYTIENGNKRSNTRRWIENALTEFNKTRSFSPGHYSGLTYHASYLIPILEMMVSGEKSRND